MNQSNAMANNVVKQLLPWIMLDTVGMFFLIAGLLVLLPEQALLDLPSTLAWGCVVLGSLMMVFALIKILGLALKKQTPR